MSLYLQLQTLKFENKNVMEISIKNTKPEILAAFQTVLNENMHQKEIILRLEKEAEEASGKKSPGMTDEDMLRIKSLIEENDELKLKKVSVVIPYVSGPAQGDELLMAVRGWATHFRENFNIVVIGERQDWMNDLVHVIECKQMSDNPPIDIAHKMMLAIESDRVTEKFIWANDDQYLVSYCMLADFETLKCTGKLGEKQFGSNVYQDNKKRTFDLLKKLGRSTWDYSSHTPFVFEKKLLRMVIEQFGLLETAHLVATLYYNFWFPEYVPYNVDTQNALFNDNFKVGVYRPNADFVKLKQLLTAKKIVNNSQSGWSKQFAEIMKSCYPQMSRFESVD